MHECPECGQACCCDMEDHWNDFASEDCVHECEPEPEDYYAEFPNCTCLEVQGEDPNCPHHGTANDNSAQ